MKSLTIGLATLAIGLYVGAVLAISAGLNMTIKFMPLQNAAPVQTAGQFTVGSDRQLQGSDYQLQGGTGIK